MDIRIIYVVISGWSIHRLQFSIICTASGKKRQQWRRTRRREGRYWTEKVWSDKRWAAICTWRRRWERWDSWCTFCLNQMWWRTKNVKYQVCLLLMSVRQIFYRPLSSFVITKNDSFKIIIVANVKIMSDHLPPAWDNCASLLETETSSVNFSTAAEQQDNKSE